MRTVKIAVIAALGVALAVAACASLPPTPANKPPALTPAERRGFLDGPYSETIAPIVPTSLAQEAVSEGGTLMTFQFHYRHTAVLTEDVVGFSVGVRGVQAPAGSPGYYAGTFASQLMVDAFGAGGGDELWCFLPALAGGRRDHLCLFLDGANESLAAIAPTSRNPYLWYSFSAPAGTNFNYVTTPIYERREVEIPGDLTFALKFEGWTDTELRLRDEAVGRLVRTYSVPRGPDGSVTLSMIVGRKRISPDPNDPSKAIIEHSN